MVKRVLTQLQAGEIRRLRSELDDWNEPKYTGMEIAAAMGVSEATVWRVLNKRAAYEKMAKVAPGGLSMEMAAAALALSPMPKVDLEVEASYARLEALLASPPKPPVSPLDELSASAKARLETYK